MREPSDYGAGVTYYAGIMGYQIHSTYVWFGQAPMPTDGTFRKMKIKLRIAPGLGHSVVFTLQKNGVDTAITCTISDVNKFNEDAVNEEHFVAGDLINYKYVTSAGISTSNWDACIEFEGDDSTESILLGGTGNSGISTGVNSASSLSGCVFCAASTATLYSQKMTSNGTKKKFYVELENSPGGAGTFTFSSGISVAITEPNVRGNNIVDTAAVVAGALSRVISIPSGGPTIATKCRWGMVFVPDNPGEFLIMGRSSVSLTTLVKYADLSSGAANTSETLFPQITQAFKIKNMDIQLANATGAGKSISCVLRIDSVDTALSIIISNSNNSNNYVDEVDIPEDSILTIGYTPINLPTSPEFAMYGFTGIISGAPPAAGGSAFGDNSKKMLLDKFYIDINDIYGVHS